MPLKVIKILDLPLEKFKSLPCHSLKCLLPSLPLPGLSVHDHSVKGKNIVGFYKYDHIAPSLLTGQKYGCGLLEIGTGALQSMGACRGGSRRERTVVWCSPELKSGGGARDLSRERKHGCRAEE
jgi:hypothetical protein